MGLGVLSDKQLREQNLEAHKRVMADRLYFSDGCKILIAEVFCFGTHYPCCYCQKPDCVYNTGSGKFPAWDENGCAEFSRIRRTMGFGPTFHRRFRRNF